MICLQVKINGQAHISNGDKVNSNTIIANSNTNVYQILLYVTPNTLIYNHQLDDFLTPGQPQKVMAQFQLFSLGNFKKTLG